LANRPKSKRRESDSVYIFEHPGCEILSGEIAERLNPRSFFQEKSCRDEGSHSPTEPLIAIDFTASKLSTMCIR
jgi:hypothetical protein